LSGYLYKFTKDERRVKLQEALATFSPGRQDLYIPTNPEARVLSHIPASGACMQSAAKVGRPALSPGIISVSVIPLTSADDASCSVPDVVQAIWRKDGEVLLQLEAASSLMCQARCNNRTRLKCCTSLHHVFRRSCLSIHEQQHQPPSCTLMECRAH